MRTFNILAGVVCVLWGGLLWLGINFAERVTAQHVPGFPNATQIFYYIGVPAAVTMTLILSAVIFNFVVRCPMCLGILSSLALIALPIYLYPYGGGV